LFWRGELRSSATVGVPSGSPDIAMISSQPPNKYGAGSLALCGAEPVIGLACATEQDIRVEILNKVKYEYEKASSKINYL
jgi:hypothetical protein